MIYKSQLKKAFSRGLRGKTNNVPGFLGRIFHRIGRDAANGADFDYVKVEDCSEWSESGVSLYYWTFKETPYQFAVLHNSKFYVLDLKVFFFDFDSVNGQIK